jgi:AraC-like DNA-binding protein
MNNQILIEMLHEIGEPDDYFAGVHRPREMLPNNILLFSRSDGASLSSGIISPDLHQRWVLIISLLGRGNVKIDCSCESLGPAEILLIPPLHLHSYAKIAKRLNWVFVTFDWPEHTVSSEAWRGIRRLGPDARNLLSSFIQEWIRPARDGLLLSSHLYRLLRALYPVHETQEADHRGNLIGSVHALQLHHPGIRLEELARKLSMSESHLRSRFREETGLSIGRYLRETRLRRAANWIKEEGLSVKCVSERAGYPDIHTFSRSFSRLFGHPPSTMR